MELISGCGGFEIIVLVALALLLYGLVITIHAIIRPASQYRHGPKAAWVTALIVLNPVLLAVLLRIHRPNGTVWVIGSLLYVCLVIAYPAAARRHAGSDPAT